MAKNKFFMMLLLVMSMFSLQLFGVDSPIKVMTDVGMSQAQETLSPAMIMWILIAGAGVSALMMKFLPLVIAVIACFIIGFSPDLVHSFSSFDWASAATPATTP